MSGDLEFAMVALWLCAIKPAEFFADRAYRAMKVRWGERLEGGVSSLRGTCAGHGHSRQRLAASHHLPVSLQSLNSSLLYPCLMGVPPHPLLAVQLGG